MMMVKNDFCDRLATLLRRQPYDKVFHKELYGILRLVCEDVCPAGAACSDFFSLLEVVCSSHHIAQPMVNGLQSLRRKSSSPDLVTEDVFRADARLLAEFIAQVYKKSVPQDLLGLLSAEGDCDGEKCVEPPTVADGQQQFGLLRVRVVGVDGTCVEARADSDALGGIIRVDCSRAGVDGSMTYVAGIVHEGSVLNLLDVSVAPSGECYARWIVFEPDYLVSPSDVAAVFDLQGASPYNYYIRLFAQSEMSLPLFIGIASGVFLDDLLAEAQSGGETVTYASSVQKVFAKMPIEFSLFMADAAKATAFHRESAWQFDNIRRLLRDKINATGGFCLQESLLEPSLVCPQAGLAGRMDFMESDGSQLIEHKSGKRDEFWGTGREPHLVQLMLYRVMIELSMGLSPDDIHAYLLYSRYADGLMSEQPTQDLLYRALEMRNRIVGMAERIANGELGAVMTEVTTDDLRINQISDKLWDAYIKPRLDRVLRRFADGGSSVACNYAERFCAFLMKENWYAKTGNPAKGTHGYADLWNCPAMERAANGDMLAGLTIDRLVSAGDRIESIVFTLPQDEYCQQTNFRLGDAVQFYSYGDKQPNVSSQYTFRGRLTALSPVEAEVALANPQHRLSLLSNSPDRHFAIEHDHIDSGNTVLCRSLFGFMEMQVERQNNFLLSKLPERGETNPLRGDYGSFNDLVAQERASSEWFLVIGPPGSGKTSRALRYMAEEELRAASHTRIMLLAYTNKAVDELCGMLEKIIADTPQLLNDYLRLGHSVVASPEYRHRMLDSRVADGCGKASEVRRLLEQTRVVVATVSTMSQQSALLGAFDFEVAFVDEASQILEPYMLPVYTQGRIGRYVLVGDQKQLPAVVMQNRDEAAVADDELNSIGIHNCSESLFCRMLHRFVSAGRNDLYCQIRAQGRMHPDLFRFVNARFYGNTLECVPLEHQRRSIESLYPVLPSQAGGNDLVDRLTHNRVVFLDCLPIDDGLNDKVNLAEAQVVAECVATLRSLYEANGRTLNADDVGVIVPYRNQISMIKACLRQIVPSGLPDLTIDTVERYQGSQRDIIIYSLTARHASQMKFLTSSVYNENDGLYDGDYPVDRKLNVALTRAREQIVVIGNRQLVEQSPLFKELIDGCAN